jgi:hypothetical protein
MAMILPEPNENQAVMGNENGSEKVMGVEASGSSEDVE